MSDKLMPFGKYKSIPIEDIPTIYLKWLFDDVDLREPLSSWVEEELEERPDE